MYDIDYRRTVARAIANFFLVNARWIEVVCMT